MKNTSIVAQAPGRINIIGEHTDYNDGFVLPAAIDRKSIFKLARNESKTRVTLASENIGNSYTFDLDNFKPLQSGWENYIMGVVMELQKLGAKLEGFEGTFGGNVPIGSGMSSSAALECSLAFGLNELFNLGLDKWQLIKVCQMAEHNFVGIKCGIMDQFASVMGKKNHAMLLDCRSLEYQYFPMDLGKYELLLLNTNVSHQLASSEYNTRREECESGVEMIMKSFPEIKNLRDVTVEMLQKVSSALPSHIFKRCHHIVTENDRVLASSRALVRKDFQQLGHLIYESHKSLQHDYEVSCRELDFLVNQTLTYPYILGSRMMGGGFGGCTINLIQKDKSEEFVELVSKTYVDKFGINLNEYRVSISNGASLIY